MEVAIVGPGAVSAKRRASMNLSVALRRAVAAQAKKYDMLASSGATVRVQKGRVNTIRIVRRWNFTSEFVRVRNPIVESTA